MNYNLKLTNKKQIAIALVTAFNIYGCAKETGQSEPSEIKFGSNLYTYTEEDNSLNIPITLDRPQFGYVQADYNFHFRDTTTHQYQDVYVPNRPVLIYGGYTHGDFSTVIFNDTLADGNDTIEFTLKKVIGNVRMSGDSTKLKTTLIIIDDDNYPANEMHVHVNWFNEESSSRHFDKDYDLDLFLLTDVVLNGNGIESSTVFLSSTTASEYENVTLKESDPDVDYYIKVLYKSNVDNLSHEKIDGIIKLSGFGYKDSNQNRWRFSFTQTDYYVYLGPFKKIGRTFVLQP